MCSCSVISNTAASWDSELSSVFLKRCIWPDHLLQGRIFAYVHRQSMWVMAGRLKEQLGGLRHSHWVQSREESLCSFMTGIMTYCHLSSSPESQPLHGQSVLSYISEQNGHCWRSTDGVTWPLWETHTLISLVRSLGLPRTAPRIAHLLRVYLNVQGQPRPAVDLFPLFKVIVGRNTVGKVWVTLQFANICLGVGEEIMAWGHYGHLGHGYLPP